MKTICIINPNSSESVTDGIAESISPLAVGAHLICETVLDAPAAIESRADIDAVVPLLERLVQRDGVDAWVIACFSDPGLAACRAATTVPVFGIAEAAMSAALCRGEHFGVISILDGSIPRHLDYVDDLGLMERLAGDRAVGLGVLELEAAPDALDRLIETGRQLRDEDGAEVLILGCAGMARSRSAVELALGIPVIDPCQAAVAQALGAALVSD